VSTDAYAALTAITDPAQRYRAARAQREASAARFSKIEEDALRELWKHHGTNADAVGRELHMSGTAVRKRLKDAPSGDPVTPVAQQDPALNFASPQEAEDALRDLRLRQENFDDQRPHFLLGALAAGVAPERITELTLAGKDELRRLRPAGNILVSRFDPYGGDSGLLTEEFAVLVEDHAAHLARQATTGAAREAARLWTHMAALIGKQIAPDARALLAPSPVRAEQFSSPEEYAEAVLSGHELAPEDHDGRHTAYDGVDDLAATNGADAWLAAFSTHLRRLAAQPSSPLPHGLDLDADRTGWNEVVSQTFRDIADAIRHLRTTGTLPSLPTDAVPEPR
jgi:hypothetical protein